MEYFTAGGGSGSILVDNLQCNGSETSVAECSHSGWNTHNCNHGQDVGIRCFGNLEGIIFLNGYKS